MCTALPYDLKHDSAQIPLLFVTTDDLKQDLRQKMLKIVSIPKGSAALLLDNYYADGIEPSSMSLKMSLKMSLYFVFLLK